MALDLYTRQGQGSVLSTAQVDDNFRRIKSAVDVLQAATSGGIGSVTNVSATVFTGLLVNVTDSSTTPTIAITTNLNGFLRGTGSGFAAQSSISLATSETSGILTVAKGGTGVNGSAFVANRILEWNGTNFVTGSASTAEITYLTGVTSNIQTQINGKENTITILPVNKGGTGLGTSPSNGQILIGNGTNYSQSTITAGTGISITNGSGTITIASTVTNNWGVSGDALTYIKTASTNAGVGTIIQNTLADTLATAYSQYTNQNSSESVQIFCAGVGSTFKSAVGTISNTAFAFQTNGAERAFFTSAGRFAKRGLNDSFYAVTVDSNVTIFSDSIGTADDIQNIVTLVAPQKLVAAETGAGIEWIGSDNSGVRHGLARIVGIDKGSFKGDLVFYTDAGTQDRSYTERFRILAEGAYIPSKATTTAFDAITGQVQALTTFDTTQKKFVYIAQNSGAKEWLNSSLFTQTNTATVSNTVAETTILGTGIGTLILPANFLNVGKVIELDLAGYMNTSGTPNLRVRVYLGSTVIYDSGNITTNATTNAGFQSKYVITCRTVGASGTVFTQGVLSYATSSTTAHHIDGGQTSAVTVNTTVSNTLNVTVEWGTASSSNNINTTNAAIKIIN
jgi:hypothetical protein